MFLTMQHVTLRRLVVIEPHFDTIIDTDQHSQGLCQRDRKGLMASKTSPGLVDRSEPVHRAVESRGATLRDRQNWRIFASFVRQEYVDCLQTIEEQLKKCQGLAEYPIFVKGENLRMHEPHLCARSTVNIDMVSKTPAHVVDWSLPAF